jgi:hypothetical protein
MPRTAQARGSRTAALRFDEKLVLNQYLLSLFEVDRFEDLAADLKDESLEGWDEHNTSYFYHQLVNSRLFDRCHLERELLLEYDQNIYRHTRIIQEKRNEPLKWKYFQYLSLLFTEIYLDRYFRDENALLQSLNAYVESFNEDKAVADKVDLYTAADLTKLAFWNATGSGKTLLMHVNILQYQYYLNRHGRINELNRIIVLTPNEGLSLQHLEELYLSGIPARIFDKDGSMAGMSSYTLPGNLFDTGPMLYQPTILSPPRKHIVEIIDIHKLKEESGQKTVAVDAFEGNNLILVDEGHSGSSGEDWKSRRDRLCENGFSFEYSATFGQAVKAAKKVDLTQEYARCILFDYSYRRFFNDGYGKMYNILNLADERHEEQKNLYMTACLLSFYQQLCIYRDKEPQLRSFNLEKPLWVFVGGKVNAVRTKRGRKVSDVVDILLFLNDFVTDKDKSLMNLDLLLNGRAGLLDGAGADIFANSFTYLIKQGRFGEALLNDILELLFNNAGAGARLHIDDLKGVDGELGLRIGDGEFFGVINVGDERELLKLCEANGLYVGDREFSTSLFNRINNRDSGINLLIGSRKFSQGWNSWRVSTMGLMNIGRREGSEIIQLFGRGVRLKGYQMSLKRSTAMNITGIDVPEYLPELETLHVFGVRADYMRQFKEYLEEEGLPAGNKPIQMELPIIQTIPPTKLKIIKLKDNVNFKKDAPRPCLSLPGEYEYRNPVVVNWYPRIQVIQSRQGRVGDSDNLETHYFTRKHIAFMNLEQVYFELQNYKNERAWYNLKLDRKILASLLADSEWYRLYIPGHELQFNDFSKVAMWQEIAVALLKKYCERFYYGRKAAYEGDKMEYVNVIDFEEQKVKEGKQGNIPAVYTFSIDPAATSFIAHLEKLIEALKNPPFKGYLSFNGCEPLVIDSHLYQPLIYLDNNQVKVSPVHLNKGERDFIVDVQDYFQKNQSRFAGKEMYLLRNQSRGRGIGFFEEGNFYPDFILWLVEDDKQYITFVDPKGLRNVDGWEDPKLKFSESIKQREKTLASGNGQAILNSFIISVTPYAKINWKGNHSKKDFEKRHVLFADDRQEYIGKMFGMIEVIPEL